ncbi:MAG: 50S ribosomal protein L10 [Alphaproteobacteria bacterium]|nr:50S ribosomal protein L10 [Alphaproteobacteria bacterium]
MNRTEKQQLIEATNTKLKSSDIALVVHNNGLTVAEMNDLRGKMREAGAQFKVTKNRLAKLATKDTAFENIADLLKGPTAIATAKDPVAVAKGLVDFAKTNEKLVIVGGAFGATKLDAKAIESLAKLPSLNELRAKIVGILQTPATRIACVLQAPGGQVARVIAAKSRKE